MVDVPYSLALPKNGGGMGTFQSLSAVVFVHGLNGQRSSMFELANDLCARGYAVFAMDIPYHGARQIAAAGRDQIHNFTGAQGPDGLAEEIAQASALEFADLIGDASLGKLEPRAPRDAFGQGALEVMWAARLLQEGDWSAARALDPQLRQLSFDNTHLLLLGISFGSFLSGLVLAVEPRFQAGLLAVPGGGLVFPALMYSLQFGPQFEPILQGAYGIDDAHRDQVAHPPEFLLEYALYQQMVEAGDALAYAPYVIRNPIGANLPKSVALLEAFADETVPNRATEPLAFALGVHLITHSQSPAAGTRYIPPLTVDPAPAIANITAGASLVTGALVQFDPATHGMLTDPTGTRHVMPEWPPAVLLPQPVPVANPTTQLHKLLVAFADSFFELPAPQVIDPF
jgi:dienelactone hydrolase